MKKYASKFLILLLLLLTAFTAQAENSIDISYDNKADVLSTTAVFSEKPSSVASIICVQIPKEKRENPATDYILDILEQNPEKVAAYNHALTDSTGSVSYECLLNPDSPIGVYTTIVICGKEKVVSSFTRISEEGLKDILIELYGKTDFDEFYTYFKELLSDLLLPVSPDKMSAASEEQLELVVKHMFDNKTTDVENFKNVCYEKLACVLIEQAERGNIISEIKKYESTLGVEASYAEKFTNLQSVYFLDLTENETFADKADFVKKYQEAVVLSIASCPENYADIKTALSTFDSIKADFNGTYSKLKDTAAVFKAMLGTKYADTASLLTAFDKAVSAQQALESTPTVLIPSGAGGGGSSRPIGGGSGSGATTAYVPAATVSSADFTDISGVEWAREAILALSKAGVVQGNGNGLFYPENMVTRAEFMKMVVEALNLNVSDAKASFEDVPEDFWAYPYIASAYKLGIVNGVSKTQFAAENNITREDMAVIIYNLCNKIGVSLSGEANTFADEAEISDYAKEAVSKLSASGIILGMDNGFMPKGNATRAQSAVIIYRIMEVLK